jgi:hypothetical protein
VIRGIDHRAFLSASMVVLLGACAAEMTAMGDTVRAVVAKDATTGVRLNPDLRYLRVTVDGRVAFVARGGVEQHPQGPIESYFSAAREVLRFQNGRLVGALGLNTEWRSVSLPELPSWSDLAKAGKPLKWERVRDVMPGYRYGVRDALVLQVMPPPTGSALQQVDPRNLVWFEEQSAGERVAGLGDLLGRADGMALPPARYAVDVRDGVGTVIYGEQCLAPTLCLAWQRWEVK